MAPEQSKRTRPAILENPRAPANPPRGFTWYAPSVAPKPAGGLGGQAAAARPKYGLIRVPANGDTDNRSVVADPGG